MSEPKIIYAVEGPINPRSGAPTLLPALGEPAEVKALRARIHALETALEPFAKAEAHEDLDFPDDQTLVEMLTGDRITLGDVRRARSVLSEKNAGKAQEAPNADSATRVAGRSE